MTDEDSDDDGRRGGGTKISQVTFSKSHSCQGAEAEVKPSLHSVSNSTALFSQQPNQWNGPSPPVNALRSIWALMGWLMREEILEEGPLAQEMS